MSSPDPNTIREALRATMTELVELNRQQMGALIQGNHRASQALGAEIERVRSRKEDLLLALPKEK